MKIFSSKKRAAAIGAVTAATLVGGTVAFAYWTTTGSGTGSAATGSSVAFDTITFSAPTPATPLAPGNGTQTFTLTVHNPGSAGSQRLSAVSVAVSPGFDFEVTDPVFGELHCTPADFTVTGVTASGTSSVLPTTLAPDQSWTGTVTVSMDPEGWNQNACQTLPGGVPLVASAS